MHNAIVLKAHSSVPNIVRVPSKTTYAHGPTRCRYADISCPCTLSGIALVIRGDLILETCKVEWVVNGRRGNNDIGSRVL